MRQIVNLQVLRGGQEVRIGVWENGRLDLIRLTVENVEIAHGKLGQIWVLSFGLESVPQGFIKNKINWKLRDLV